MKTALSALLLLCTIVCYAQNTPKPIILGEAYTLHSTTLSEDRTLNIYLPEGYQNDDTTHYPVIYLLDGGTDEDFIHVVGAVQFNSFPWVDRLPPTIVVGIANTDRKRDMTFPTNVKADKQKYPTTGGSARFVGYIDKEVRPFVNKTFRTNGNTTLIGESLAGLLATEILLSKPQMFDNYIIVSPSIWWDNGSILQRAATKSNRRTKIYIAVGKEGLTPSDPPRVMETDANLLNEKISALHNGSYSVYFDYLPDEDHATIAHQAIMNAFRWLHRTDTTK
jgi:uncharacterized protein